MKSYLSYVLRTDHPLAAVLEKGLRLAFRSTIRTMKPGQVICINYVRIGYDENNMHNNPIIVWIMAEKNQVTREEAQRVVDEFYEHCIAFQMSDIEVEMVEAERTSTPTFPEELTEIQNYPSVGSSISVAIDPNVLNPRVRTGTLGGYACVDGKVYGITDHHVIFGDKEEDLKDSYPGKQYDTVIKNDNGIVVNQPSDEDLVNAIKKDRQIMEGLETLVSRSHLQDLYLQITTNRLAEWQKWTAPRLPIGTVFKTSGLYVPATDSNNINFRRDIAIIELNNSDRCPDNTQFNNRLPNLYLMTSTNSPHYIERAMILSDERTPNGNLKRTKDFPHFLKRALKQDEIKNKMIEKEISKNNVTGNSSNYVLWKIERSTHVTTALANGIYSDYIWPDGKTTSSKFMIKSLSWRGNFTSGDSGALVFDTDGYVAGQLWGEIPGTDTSFFFTPMDTVLETMRR